MRPGWGLRHPDLAVLLATLSPEATQDTTWADGTVPLRISAYAAPADLPNELVISVRCLVRVDDRIVVCTNADGISHAWPGGRREPGESLIETACREVLEETGWVLDVKSLEHLGWLHLEHRSRPPENHPYPHPDFLQVVYAGRAHERSGGRDSEWTDTAGYELSSCLMAPDEAYAAVDGDPLSRVFLDLITG